MQPSGLAHRGRDPVGTVTDARLVREPGRAEGRAGNSSRGLPGHCNDVVQTPHRQATSSGGACVRPTLDRGAGSGDATSDSLWATRQALPAGDHRRGHHLPCPTAPFSMTPGPTEEPAESPIPAWEATATSATGYGRTASGGLTTDAPWWRRPREASGAGAQASRRAGQRLHAPIEPRPAAGASIRPPRSPPPRRAGWLPTGCWSPRHSPPSPDAAPLDQRLG
jgi:hypothetical protein